MKYLFLVVTIFMLQIARSQSFYGSASAGYQYILNQYQAPSLLTNSYHQISSPWFWGNQNFEFEHMLTADVSFGYFFNDNIGIEVSGSYLKPKTLTSFDGFTSKEFLGNFWRVNPKLVLQVPIKSFDLFTKIGGTIGSGKILFRQEFQNDGSLSLSYDVQTMAYEYTEALSFGFSASIGVSKSISKHIELFSEIQLIHHTFSPTKGKMTEYTFGDIDGIEQYEYDSYFSEIEFGNESESYYWNSEDTSQPQKLYKRNYSLSGIGINLGIKITLWSKQKEVISTP